MLRIKMQSCAAICAVVFLSTAVRAERQYLWPDGKMPDAQPQLIAAMTDVSRGSEFAPDDWRRPYVDWCDAPQNPNGVCMILISGGGYYNLCDVGLVKSWARELTAIGCQCVNLVYRSPRPNDLPIYQTAWEDGQRAVRLVRSEAAKRGFDPERIGTISMSAGSHLATLLATSSQTPAYKKVDALDDTPCHINWAIAFAPAYVLADGYGIPNSRRGEGPDSALADCFKFDEKTPPMCLLHGGADVYSPLGSTMIYRELRRRNIPAEVHVFPGKRHGAHGFERALEFMRQMKFLGALEPEVALTNRYPSVTHDAAQATKIWPAGKMPDAQSKQNEPTIVWHVPTNLTTKAIQIIWSGGAYKGSAPNGFEVEPMRQFLNEKGVTVVVLDYRCPRPDGLAKHTTAWEDAQRAVRLVKAGAKERGLDPNRIGVMGSSAGGHLALMAATTSKTDAYLAVDDFDKISPSVAWAVAIYPAYVLTDGIDGTNKNGGNGEADRFAPEFAFDLATPPVFFIHGDGDGYSSMGSVKAWEQLRRMGIQGELHTLAKRGHCFQRAASPGTGSYNWMEIAWGFIEKLCH